MPQILLDFKAAKLKIVVTNLTKQEMKELKVVV